MQNQTNNKERIFSVELKSKAHLKNITMTNGSSESVLIEGTLGKLERARFAEGIILEIVGSNGILRVDIGEGEIKKAQLKDEKVVK
jgi:hypothetical protein